MYKRKFRVWGLRKNARHKGSLATSDNASGRPRYLPQNDVDEALHTLLDLLTPWVTQSFVLWASSPRTRHMRCPPRAAYIYDDFAHGIAVAAAAFRSGDSIYGGSRLRQAFIDLERTLSPRARSSYTLHCLFFALATLNQAGMFEASRMLLSHATNFVALRTQMSTDDGEDAQSQLVGQLEPELGQEPENVDKNGHVSHPFPQILKRLKRLVVELNTDDTTMTKSIFLAWSAYHRATSAESARSVAVQATQREFWHTAFRTPRSSTSLSSAITFTRASWVDAIQPVLHDLNTLLDYAEGGTGNDLSLLYLDEIASVYSFSGHESFEATALGLLARVRSKCTTRTELWQWGCNASLELANYYLKKGDWDKTIEYLAFVIPDRVQAEWEALITQEFQRWKQESRV